MNQRERAIASGELIRDGEEFRAIVRCYFCGKTGALDSGFKPWKEDFYICDECEEQENEN